MCLELNSPMISIPRGSDNIDYVNFRPTAAPGGHHQEHSGCAKNEKEKNGSCRWPGWPSGWPGRAPQNRKGRAEMEKGTRLRATDPNTAAPGGVLNVHDPQIF